MGPSTAIAILTELAEQQEPEVALRQMTDGLNVIEDYSHTGLPVIVHAFPTQVRQ
jgi:hypothetical protein